MSETLANVAKHVADELQRAADGLYAEDATTSLAPWLETTAERLRTAMPSPAAPDAPKGSLAAVAQEGADYLMSAAASVRCMRDGEELATRLGEVEARLRSAIAAEEERQRLRTDAALAWLALPGSVQYLETCDALRRWAERETTPAQRAGRLTR